MASHYDDDEVSDAANCPMCLEMTEHDVLKRIRKGKGEDILARCLECSDVHLIELRPPEPIFLNTTFLGSVSLIYCITYVTLVLVR